MVARLPLAVKQKLTPLVMFSVHQHWIFLVIFIAASYFTGSALAEPKVGWPLSASTTFFIHEWSGKLLLLTAAFLAVEKLYLIGLRKQWL